jgi:hypothetical protein
VAAELAHHVDIVDAHAQARLRVLLCQIGQRAQLARTNDLVGDEHVGDAAGQKWLGLARLLHANANAAGRHLAARDLHALMALGMRPHPQLAPHCIHEPRQVALKAIQVEQQRRRVDVFDGVTGSGGLPAGVHGVTIGPLVESGDPLR